MQPPSSLVPIRVEHSDQCHHWWSIEATCNIMGAAILVLNVQMEMLQICGPFLMVIVLQISLCLYELQGSVVCVDDHFFPQNVMLRLTIDLHNGIVGIGSPGVKFWYLHFVEM